MMKPLLTGIVITIATGNAFAQTANLRFEGTVTEPEPSCTIVVEEDGKIVLDSPDVLTSDPGLGGKVATAAITASHEGKFHAFAQAPGAFTSAPANVTAEFEAYYELSGATIAKWSPGSFPAALKEGDADISVILRSISTAGAFPVGQYVADVTVICE